MFKKNEGAADRVIRGVLGVALFIAAYYSAGTTRIIFAVIGVAALVTGAVGFCGLYSLLKMNTLKKEAVSEIK